jgi:hypothetical protein
MSALEAAIWRGHGAGDRNWSADIATVGFIAGFTVMMALDNALG